MRVLLLGKGWFPDEPGGLNRYFRGILETLGGRVEARAVVLGPAADAPAEVVAPARADDPLLARVRAYAAAAGREGRDADLVHAHFALYSLLPLVTRLRRKPVVLQFQGPWADEAVASRAVNRLGAGARRTVERTVYRRARHALVLSSAFRRVLVERYGFAPWNVHVVPPGVELDTYSPGDRAAARRALDVPDDAFLGVTARRLVARMGVDVLLEAWAALPESAVLLIAGEGDERPALERQARALGIEHRVRFLGNLDDRGLVPCYRGADVSIVPTIALEGFGIVCLESLACGTPVVATDVGGLREVLGPLDPTLVVAPRDPAALARRLTAPLPSREACRAYAERYTWERAAAATERVYRLALDDPPAGRPRVVFLDHTAVLSGGELALLRLVPALEHVDTHVVLAEDGPLAHRLTAAGVSVEVLPLRERARGLHRRRALADPAAALLGVAYAVRLGLHLRRLRPDVVHANSLKSGLYGSLATAIARTPLVWHVRDRLADDYLPRSVARVVRRAMRARAAAVIANSAATRATLPDDVDVIVVPSPVSIAARAPTAAGRELRIGMIGRLAPWKGQDVFLRAFARAFPTDGATARVIGAPLFSEDEHRYAESLRDLAAELGLAGRVQFPGFVEQVEDELAALDVVVHASVLAEPFGQVVAEGMAAGIAVVAADAGGPAEILEHGRTGLLYPPGDVEALADALRRLAQDAGLRARLGDAARVDAQAFSPAEVAARVEQVYAKVLKRA
jgi:glycosyltransferase involved in cell wall biosynthesis